MVAIAHSPDNALPLGQVTPKTHTPEWRMQELGHRYYSPKLGRWISRDPIGEDGGRNLFLCVLNNPLNYVDSVGLEWTEPDRRGGPRANVECNCGDTVGELAEMIGLSEDEFTEWLKDEDKKGLPSGPDDPIMEADRVFSVPNTGYVDASTYTWGFLWAFLMGQSQQMRARWEEEGLRVVYNKGANTSRAGILQHLGSDDIYRFAYFGHGAAGQLTAIRDSRVLPADQEWLRGILVAGKYTQYGIEEMALYACESAGNADKWAQNVSYRGVLLLIKEGEDFQCWDAFQEDSFVIIPGTAR